MNEQQHPDPLDAERYFGSRLLLAAGALALIIGATFFFKLAFENGWIGTSGRVALGLIAGSALMVWSDRVRATLNHLFSESVTALGACVLYLSLWAAGNGFHLVPITVSFAAMVLLTGTLIVLALRRNSEITAALGLVGGFLTPTLTYSGTPDWINLYSYIALLSGALIFVPPNRGWKLVTPAAFVLTQLYFFSGLFAYQTHAAGAPPVMILISFATLYLAIFNWGPVRKTLAHERVSATDVMLVLLSAGAYYGTLHATLYAEHRLALTAAIVVLSFAYVALAYLEPFTRTLFATIALTLSTGGVAVAFDGHAITAIWAIDGALLAWAGCSMRLPIARLFAFIAFICGLGHLALAFPEGGAYLFNERFVTLVLFGMSLAVARVAGDRYRAQLTGGEQYLFTATEALANIFIAGALSDQLWAWSRGNELAITLAWAIYGMGLLIAGFASHSQYRRMQALILLACAFMKAFVVDLNTVDPAVRIISFLVIGAVLLGGSYWYFRMCAQSGGAE